MSFFLYFVYRYIIYVKFILKKYKLITLKLYILSQKNVVINEIYLKKINKSKSASKP